MGFIKSLIAVCAKDRDSEFGLFDGMPEKAELIEDDNKELMRAAIHLGGMTLRMMEFGAKIADLESRYVSDDAPPELRDYRFQHRMLNAQIDAFRNIIGTEITCNNPSYADGYQFGICSRGLYAEKVPAGMQTCEGFFRILFRAAPQTR